MAASKGNPTNPADRVLDKRAPRGHDSSLPPRVPVFVLVAGALFAVVFAVATIFRVLPTPLYLLLGLSLATAVIAYWSDQLGMKLGKKRISLFGLRPRQTATLISIGSSWLIMLFSVAVLLLIYSPLKDALLRYDDTKSDNKKLSVENQILERNIVAQQKDVETRSRQNAVLSRKIERQNNSLRTLSVEIGARQTDLTRAKADLQTSQAARDRAKTAQTAAQAAQREAEVAKREAESARQNAESGQARARQGETAARVRTTQAQARFVQAQALYSQALTKLSAATSQLVTAQNAVVNARAEVKRAENKLSSTRNELKREITKTTEAKARTSEAEKTTQQALQQQNEAIRRTVQTENQNARLETEIAEKQQQLSQLQGQLVQLKRALADTETLLADAQSVLSITATLVIDPSQTAMNAGQVLAAKTLPANSSEEKARVFLTQLVAQGRQNVQRDGWQSLYLAPISVSEGDKLIELNEEQIIPSLAAYLSQFDTPASVRLFAARDHAKGEPEIVARLLAYPVKTAFASGEVLAQTTIEVPTGGAAGDAQIFNQLLRLVDRGGKTEAQKRGVVPLITVETPNFFAPDTNLRIFEAMRELQSLGAGRRATVKLVAAEAISTVESPRVRFEIS